MAEQRTIADLPCITASRDDLVRLASAMQDVNADVVGALAYSTADTPTLHFAECIHLKVLRERINALLKDFPA